MQLLLEPGEGRVVIEHDLRQSPTIDAALVQDAVTEDGRDTLDDVVTLEQAVDELVGRDRHGAEVAQEGRRGRLA